jgi:hypothetical protein
MIGADPCSYQNKAGMCIGSGQANVIVGFCVVGSALILLLMACYRFRVWPISKLADRQDRIYALVEDRRKREAALAEAEKMEAGRGESVDAVPGTWAPPPYWSDKHD